MSLLAAPPSPSAATPAAETIQNDGWFPDIKIADMREAMRIDGNVTAPRLRDALVAAILHVNSQLAEWRQKQIAHAKLSEMPGISIDGESHYLALYRRAVYSSAKADLIERYRDYDATDEGLRKAENLLSSIDEQRRNAQWAIADIVGRTRTTIELI